MYGRYTDRARKVMTIANAEALKRGDTAVGTEHILLGLVLEGFGVGCAALKNLGVTPTELYRVLAETLPRADPQGSPDLGGRLCHTMRARRVAEFAKEESAALKHTYQGTEHVALGLVRDETCTAAVILMQSFKVMPEALRGEVLTLIGKRAMPLAGKIDSEFIVAEVTKNWPGPAFRPDSPTGGVIANQFERAIEFNRRRGYELHSWQLHRMMVPNPDTRVHLLTMNETIVAVFRRVRTEDGDDAPAQAG